MSSCKAEIIGERVVLKPLTERDCNSKYLEWLTDPAVNTYLETRWQKQTLETIQKFVTDVNASKKDFLYGITLKENGNHIGNIKLGEINPNHLDASISYFIGDKQEWGKGYASDAIKSLTAHGFNNCNLHRIHAGVYESNHGSIKALIKCGFELEGRFKKKLRGIINLHFHDVHICLSWLDAGGFFYR